MTERKRKGLQRVCICAHPRFISFVVRRSCASKATSGGRRDVVLVEVRPVMLCLPPPSVEHHHHSRFRKTQRPGCEGKPPSAIASLFVLCSLQSAGRGAARPTSPRMRCCSSQTIATRIVHVGLIRFAVSQQKLSPQGTASIYANFGKRNASLGRSGLKDDASQCTGV